MGITLVPHVEDQAISFKVKDTVQCYCQFHQAQIGCQMASRLGYVFNQGMTKLTAQLYGLCIIHSMQLR